jgi:hypothetical protein
MATKKQTPPPIDRPLSRAYLRQFVGWSTAYPPGQSEPNSLRLMANLWVDRNGALNTRPGLRHLSLTAPETAMDLPVIGSPELFYLDDGSRALLVAVREATGKVGFRALLSTVYGSVVHRLTDPEVGFSVPQGEEVLSFDPGTAHVKYLQINNRILALSDDGEPARMFYVGGQKLAKKLKAVSVPEWSAAHKLTVLHPDAAWIGEQARTLRTNVALNPSFEVGTRYWTKSDSCAWRTVADTGQQGGRALEIASAPARTNMQPRPLHEVPASGSVGWTAGQGDPLLGVSGSYLEISPSSADSDFLVVGPVITEGVREAARYVTAVDVQTGSGDTVPQMVLESLSADGRVLSRQRVAMTGYGSGRWSGPALVSSDGAAALRLSLGGTGSTSVRFRNVLVCAEGEPTGMFYGDSGSDTFWTGEPGNSASIHHPPADVRVRTHTYAVPGGAAAMAGSVAIRKMQAEAANATVSVLMYTTDLANPTVERLVRGPSQRAALTGSWARYAATATAGPTAVSCALEVLVPLLPRGAAVRLDGALLEAGAGGGAYFDGSSPSDADTRHTWSGVTSNLPHEGPSLQAQLAGSSAPTAETPTLKTLVASGGAESNPYKIAFFYTIENDIGESAASQVAELRMSRAWSDWRWETPNATGEPSGTYTAEAHLSADQLVVVMPQAVYDQAVRENALRWNLYALSWPEQGAVPVEGSLIASQDIYPDQATSGAVPLPYPVGGRIQVTAARRAGTVTAWLPTPGNRLNSSLPPAHRNGLVAGDRMVLVGSPYQPATIQWSSSAPGRYTMFTPNTGGGEKALTSGNLNLPYSVALWQNPQSADTITVLCSDDNGRSVSYYMAPATVEAGSSGSFPVMGFEETTSTPGTVAPFGVEVLNNGLYRPLGMSLLKSTASNYNINHKTQTDKIANAWQLLESKQRIMSSQLDNRLYYLVHNPQGETLALGCRGNEVWVLDAASEMGHWSRFLVQGGSLKPITIGSHTFMSVSRPDGLYYLDEEAVRDHAVVGGMVLEQQIPWSFETNTQGANRAHDAWAHLQQVGVVLGNFSGTMRYGVRGRTLHGTEVDVAKVFTDAGEAAPTGQRWDVEDVLLVRRDMKEWYLYASSVDGRPGTGQLGVVQYRYTPVSVNVGYEFGSVETFEYGADAQGDGTSYSRNAVPLPYLDYGRP